MVRLFQNAGCVLSLGFVTPIGFRAAGKTKKLRARHNFILNRWETAYAKVPQAVRLDIPRDKHWAESLTKHCLGVAPVDQAIKPTITMRGHHNQTSL